MRVGLLAYSSAASTMGLEVIADSVRREFPEWHVAPVDETTAKECDYLLVSLYWWRDVYAHVAFLSRIGLNPRKRKPIIIIGGMMCVNPRPLEGYYHFAVVGDGEDVIGPVIDALEHGNDPYEVPGVWNPTSCETAVAKRLPAKAYTEIRTNKVSRIEIARGCKMGCAFCQLAATKPYREVPVEVVKQLILSAPTKTVALFAPDRASHSRYKEIELYLAKHGKRNSGSDVRLTSIRGQKIASTVRFGVESMTASGRKAIGKPMSDDNLLRHLRYISEDMRTPKGKRITNATCYLIGDLPCEHEHDPSVWWDLLRRWDETLTERFTLFLSLSSFIPSPHTRLERAAIHPFSGLNRRFQMARPHYKHLIIATRGGLIGPGPRLAQVLTVRGDETCRRAIHHIATQERRLLSETSVAAGHRVEAIVRAAGYNPLWLSEEWTEDRPLPWGHVSRPWVQATRPKRPIGCDQDARLAAISES